MIGLAQMAWRLAQERVRDGYGWYLFWVRNGVVVRSRTNPDLEYRVIIARLERGEKA